MQFHNLREFVANLDGRGRIPPRQNPANVALLASASRGPKGQCRIDSRRPHQRLRQGSATSTSRRASFPAPSRKKQRGEFSPGADRCRIDRPPGVEKLQQLLARAIVVPGPVAFDDFNELGGRHLAPILGIEEDGEIETRLMVAGVGRGPVFQFINLPKWSCCAGPFQAAPSSRLSSANLILSLIKPEFPRPGELAYDVKKLAARGLCFRASPLRSASGTKGA